MDVVAFPKIAESFIRAWHDVVSPFFNGSTHTIGGVATLFPSVKLNYSTLRAKPIVEPVIAMVGDRVHDENRFKVEDPNHTLRYAYELRAKVEREVYVAYGLSSGKINGTEETARAAIRTYDLLKAVILTQLAAFAARGILVPVLSAVPREIPDKDNSVVCGLFTCEIAVKYHCG